MKTRNFLKIFLALAFGLSFAGQLMARDFTVKPLAIEGLEDYPQSNVTLYLVHASKVFGSEFTVNKVFKVLTTVPVKGNRDISFGPFVIKQNWSSFVNPNAVMAIVHDQAKHALNKHGIIDGTPTTFAEPEYQNQGEKVPVTEENKKLRARSAATLLELSTDASIHF